MKITSNISWLDLDVYDLFHLFIKDSKQDDQYPLINYEIHQNVLDLSINFNILFEDNKRLEFSEFVTLNNYKSELELKRYMKRAIKKILYIKLSNYFEKKLVWGCLTGIRPTSVARDLIENGVDKYFIREEMEKQFLISSEKSKLVDRILKNQNFIIKNDKLIDFYVNIPFCPTKCSYCSFISSEYCKVEKIIPDYIDALIKEINEAKKIIKDNYFIVKSVYVGGGTPSVLSSNDLEKIISELNFGVNEFTVECGRPETITKEKLDVLKKYGVTRISINPQSFVDATLKRIGRKHTSKDVIEAYKLAIPYEFSINMDIIAGLPGENLKGFKKTLQTTIDMFPDNITVHTLAIKKGSALSQEEINNENDLTQKMVSLAHSVLIENQYKPYYMYKLKNQNAGLENVGFFMDKPCIFNVDSMEETASIIACGANAISKKIFFDEKRIERQANVKFAKDYIERIDEMIDKKRQLFKTK